MNRWYVWMRSPWIKRILTAPLILWIMVSVSFFLIRLVPGSPFLEEKAYPPDVQQSLQSRYHLDKPLWVQYGLYLKGILKGDFGPSLKYPGQTVQSIIARHWPQSFRLGCLALFFALFLGLTSGILSAWQHRNWLDYLLMMAAVIGISLPTFVIGPLFQVFLTYWLPNWPITGGGSWRHLLVPAITLSLPFAARIARLTRAGFLEVLHEDYIRTARAKGLSEWRVLRVHASRGGILPVVGYLGPAIASITTGSLVIEQVFAIPGLGREFIASALNRDYMLVLGTVIVYGSMIIIANFLCDLLYLWLDPRIRLPTESQLK